MVLTYTDLFGKFAIYSLLYVPTGKFTLDTTKISNSQITNRQSTEIRNSRVSKILSSLFCVKFLF